MTHCNSFTPTPQTSNHTDLFLMTRHHIKILLNINTFIPNKVLSKGQEEQMSLEI